jgi:23S rRNA (uracil1939-C5)-methyltransferase
MKTPHGRNSCSPNKDPHEKAHSPVANHIHDLPHAGESDQGQPDSPPASPQQKLKIEKLIYGGWGLARLATPGLHGSRVVFLPDVLPGEEVQAELFASRRHYAKARPIRILSPSPDRLNPLCPISGICGGCQLQHMNESSQMAYKQQTLVETIQRIGQLQVSPLPIIRARDSYHYRHRIQLKIEQTGRYPEIGFFRRESHHIVPLTGCPILHPALERMMEWLREAFQGGLSFLHHPTEIHLQYSSYTDQTLVIFYADQIQQAGLGGFFDRIDPTLSIAGIIGYTGSRRRYVCGQSFLLHELKGMTFRISDQTFAQPNWSMNELMTDEVLKFAQLKGQEIVLELYSGMGNFSLLLAKQAKRAIAMESHAQAVRDAKYNAGVNQVRNIAFHCCNVKKGLAKLSKRSPHLDLIMLDPPRQGIGRDVLQWISNLHSPRILYLSCDPTTLARDLTILRQYGYRLDRLQPFDLLPQTYHLEALAEFRRA